MSSIDDLCYYMASEGYPPDIIAKTEQAVLLRGTLVSGVHPHHIVSAKRAMLAFEAGMKRIETSAGTAMSEMQAIAQGIEAMADIPEAKPPAKQPYYQKNKQQWWR